MVWVKLRKRISRYPNTDQQKKVKVAGELISLKCKGKKGLDFKQCRSEVLDCIFKDKCEVVTKDKVAEVAKELGFEFPG